MVDDRYALIPLTLGAVVGGKQPELVPSSNAALAFRLFPSQDHPV